MDFEDADVRPARACSSYAPSSLLTPVLCSLFAQPDQFIEEGDVGVSGAADQEEELGDAAGAVNGSTTGAVSPARLGLG